MEKRLAHHAERIGLAMVDPNEFDIELRRKGEDVSLCFPSGETIDDERLRERVEALVIPPAWEDVRICVDENGHIQAIGRDEKHRLQYRYHDRWVDVRNAVKTERLLRFGHALPKLRRRIQKDMRRRKADRLFTSAAAARLVDVAAMRPGHEKYAADGGRGVASLRRQNLRIGKKRATLKFVGKSNKSQEVAITDKPLIHSLKRIRKGRGQRLFRFPDENKNPHRLTANLLNDYIQNAAGKPVSAKDFRNFHGSAEALRFLIEEIGDSADSDNKRKKAVSAAMRSVSETLRNTPAVARSSYVHPEIVSAFHKGELDGDLMKGRRREGLTREETGLMRFLEEVAKK